MHTRETNNNHFIYHLYFMYTSCIRNVYVMYRYTVYVYVLYVSNKINLIWNCNNNATHTHTHRFIYYLVVVAMVTRCQSVQTSRWNGILKASTHAVIGICFGLWMKVQYHSTPIHSVHLCAVEVAVGVAVAHKSPIQFYTPCRNEFG